MCGACCRPCSVRRCSSGSPCGLPGVRPPDGVVRNRRPGPCSYRCSGPRVSDGRYARLAHAPLPGQPGAGGAGASGDVPSRRGRLGTRRLRLACPRPDERHGSSVRSRRAGGYAVTYEVRQPVIQVAFDRWTGSLVLTVVDASGTGLFSHWHRVLKAVEGRFQEVWRGVQMAIQAGTGVVPGAMGIRRGDSRRLAEPVGAGASFTLRLYVPGAARAGRPPTGSGTPGDGGRGVRLG